MAPCSHTAPHAMPPHAGSTKTGGACAWLHGAARGVGMRGAPLPVAMGHSWQALPVSPCPLPLGLPEAMHLPPPHTMPTPTMATGCHARNGLAGLTPPHVLQAAGSACALCVSSPCGILQPRALFPHARNTRQLWVGASSIGGGSVACSHRVLQGEQVG